LALGYRYLLLDRTVERANPFLLDLNRACGETVNFSEPDGTDMVYVGRFPTHKTTPVHMPLGRRLSMYCTSSGRAYMSLLPPKERQALLEASARVPYTPSTVTDIGKLLVLCEEAAQRGFAYSASEYYPGDLNVAAAVFDASGRPLGARQHLGAFDPVDPGARAARTGPAGSPDGAFDLDPAARPGTAQAVLCRIGKACGGAGWRCAAAEHCEATQVGKWRPMSVASDAGVFLPVATHS
jgi:DNA-binding IclR family transcriptional regulator